MVLAMVVLGGLGSVPGAILGALVLGTLPELLRGFEQYRMLLFGLVMIAMMRLRPQGLLGSVQIRRELRFRFRESACCSRPKPTFATDTDTWPKP
jgi:branched-chain amino acid transport system permease protein